MFEENYKEMELTDAEIYFLAKELKLNQIIGLGFDFDSMNKELKVGLKQESYDLFAEQKALKMDFFGNTTVNENYEKIIKAFEYPDFCGIVQHLNIADNSSFMRKAYKNGGAWTALDYVGENLSSVYEFNSSEEASAFLFYGVTIDENANDIHISFENIEAMRNAARDLVIFTEYKKENENDYSVLQKVLVFIDGKGWFTADSGDEGKVELIPNEKSFCLQ